MRLLGQLVIFVIAFGCSTEAKCLWVSKDSVECNLKILDFRRNSSSAAMQVPEPGLSEAKSLKISCSDVFFFESQLRSDHFGSLDKVTDLEISYCKLRTLPPRTFVGLRDLANLVIHTHNEDWTSLQMEPDYESLVGLERLQRMDMRLNNLHEIPPGFFCPLKNLRHIDLSYNSIADLNSLGLSHQNDRVQEEFRCSIPVSTMLLSNNGLVTVTPGSLGALRASLKHIELSHNNVDVLVDTTFKGLDQLESIDLSFNRLAAIPPKIFTYTPSLRTLILANNTLGTIDLNVFNNLSSLQMLNLSGNNLDENWIRHGIFSKLHSLVVLDLSSNHIARLDEGLLDDLTALQVLNLGHNKIHTIATQSFLNLANLHILVLKHNQMEILQRQTLTGLSLLSSLDLDHNRLHTLHSGSLRNCTSLASLGLGHNFLTQVPEAVHQLSSLQVLDLGSNLLGVLKRESLQGLPKLQVLRLGDNELSRLGEGAFVEVSGLLELDLSKNRLMSLDQETFKDIKSLQTLDLSENQLEDVNGLFTHQVSLLKLNLSANHLLWFDYAFVPPSLESLDIHSNKIDSLGNYFALRDNYSLKYVDASVNEISALHVLSLLPGMVEIDLSNNTISRIAANTFLGKRRLVKVHLERNRLESLDASSLMVSLGPNDQPPQFFLAGNPLICNCNLQWFHQVATVQLQNPGLPAQSLTSMNQLYPEIPDFEHVTCRVLNTSDPSKHYLQSFTQLDEEEFLCPYETHCLALCLCCDFLACDCQMKCPDDCQCFHDQLWSANVVQCSSRQLSHVPSLVPMDVTALHLSANNLTRLTQTMFLGRTRLKKVYVDHSNVNEIENGTFSGLDHLEVVNLGHNQLKQLMGYEFSGAVSLRELYLEQNQLVTIAADTFKDLSQLRVLRLDGNLLIEFPIWELSSNKYLNSLTLASNWWNCECSFVRKFRMFIDTLGNSVVKDANDIACNSDHDSRNRHGGHANCHSILPSNHIYITDTAPYGSGQIVPVVAGTVGLCVALLAVVCTCICLKDRCRIWLHSRYGIRIELKEPKPSSAACSTDEGQPAILFDGLVLYSSKDNEPIISEICHNLEPAYRLCLLHRDLAGIYTSEAFKSALLASRTHLVVLSRAFMATEWQHMQDLVLNYKSLIVIQVDDLETPKSSDVKKFTKASTKLLKWSSGDDQRKQFWNALKYYLPDPPRLPTKEGGAELDISGVWTYNDAAVTMSGSPTSATAVKKKQQCSIHSSIADSGIYESQLIPVSSHPHNPTRSCGTNAVHQRSNSALVETISGARESSPLHQRSKSFFATPETKSGNHGLLDCPPTPPPKVGKMMRPPAESTYASPMLLQLAAFSPDLLGSLNSTLTTPLSTSPASLIKIMSPVTRVKTKGHNHQKSRSLLFENSLSSATPQMMHNNFATPHRRSSSMLDPAYGQAPSLVLSSNNLYQPSSQKQQQAPAHYYSKNAVQHSRSVSMLDEPKLLQNKASAIKLENLSSRKVLNMSTSQLQHLAATNRISHKRSSSTPYEGFVL